MAIVGILLWWYTDGWIQTVRSVRLRLAGLFDYFSLDILLKTLFSPFRQISAGTVDGPLPVKFRAFVDRLVSRFVGGIVRLLVLGIGIVSIVVASVVGLGYIFLWAVLPLSPIVGLILSLLGWVPWTIL
ncbi:MAG TPA: hypothetical protein VL362_03550 [Patescibacteria group bacterium]|nr:hypothetical protein [Patescibacteria group bacterium]